MHVGSDERLWQHWPGAVTHGYARAFGERGEDLDLDFTALARADLVSSVLAACLRSDDASWLVDDVWSWTLAQRLQALLAVSQAGQAAPITLLQRCTQCGESLELQVEPSMFEREERVIEFFCTAPSGATLRIALPTGQEQRRWFNSGELTLRAMAHTLVREIDGAIPAADWDMPDEWIELLAQQLEQHDPLTALELETDCPACQARASVALDLEAELLAQLQQRQRQTLASIHRLASTYHWSEAIILNLPAWRRRYYLAQLDAAERA